MTDPAAEAHTFEYLGGLMTSHVDPRKNEKTYSYTGLGRLRLSVAFNGEGGHQSYSRTRCEGAPDITVSRSTSQGALEKYTYSQLRTGATVRGRLAADGTSTYSETDRSGFATIVAADGSQRTSRRGADARFVLPGGYTSESSLELPSGKTTTSDHFREVELADRADPFSLERIQVNQVRNGKLYHTLLRMRRPRLNELDATKVPSLLRRCLLFAGVVILASGCVKNIGGFQSDSALRWTEKHEHLRLEIERGNAPRLEDGFSRIGHEVIDGGGSIR